MTKVLDVILIVISAGVVVGLSLYKVTLFYRYRDDPAKREALFWSGQVYPKWLARFIFDEDSSLSAREAPKSGRK